MKNTSDYTLMSGDVNVFMNNSYVTSAFISVRIKLFHTLIYWTNTLVKRVSPQESFTCPLGVDPNVSVTMQPQFDEISGPGCRIFSSKPIKTTKSRSVTVKNASGLTVQRLILKDQVPITSDQKVKVHITSPIGLPNIKERSLKEVSVDGNKVKARWSPWNQNDEKNGYANEEGFIDWICRVDAGETLNFKLCWEVKAPKKFKWDVIG